MSHVTIALVPSSVIQAGRIGLQVGAAGLFDAALAKRRPRERGERGDAEHDAEREREVEPGNDRSEEEREAEADRGNASPARAARGWGIPEDQRPALEALLLARSDRKWPTHSEVPRKRFPPRGDARTTIESSTGARNRSAKAGLGSN
jgi:hypothetical protein